MTFIGIDLAWSPRNPTGAAVLRGTVGGADLIDYGLLGDDGSIIDYIARHAGEAPALVAVDAPLWVPNPTGRRPGEAEISRAFGCYQAGAHPANRSRLAFGGIVRGEALVAALGARGFVHAPEVVAEMPVRQVIEVFPHPAMVALFGLKRTLKYKAKSRRSADLRLSEWQRYQAYLAALVAAQPDRRGGAARRCERG